MANVTHGNNVIPNKSLVIGTYSSFYFESSIFVDPDPGDTISTYSAAGMPKGINFAAASRTFYGTPYLTNALRDYPITVWATGSDGSKDSLTFTLHLGPRYEAVPYFTEADMRWSAPGYISRTITENTSVNTLLTPSTGITAIDSGGLATDTPYEVMWADSNSATQGYGVNTSPFDINSNGQLYVADNVDYETKSQYTLLIEARDIPVGTAPQLNAVARVKITVNNVSGMYTTYKGLAGGISILQYDQE